MTSKPKISSLGYLEAKPASITSLGYAEEEAGPTLPPFCPEAEAGIAAISALGYLPGSELSSVTSLGYLGAFLPLEPGEPEEPEICPLAPKFPSSPGWPITGNQPIDGGYEKFYFTWTHDTTDGVQTGVELVATWDGGSWSWCDEYYYTANAMIDLSSINLPLMVPVTFSLRTKGQTNWSPFTVGGTMVLFNMPTVTLTPTSVITVENHTISWVSNYGDKVYVSVWTSEWEELWNSDGRIDTEPGYDSITLPSGILSDGMTVHILIAIINSVVGYDDGDTIYNVPVAIAGPSPYAPVFPNPLDSAIPSYLSGGYAWSWVHDMTDGAQTRAALYATDGTSTYTIFDELTSASSFTTEGFGSAPNGVQLQLYMRTWGQSGNPSASSTPVRVATFVSLPTLVLTPVANIVTNTPSFSWTATNAHMGSIYVYDGSSLIWSKTGIDLIAVNSVTMPSGILTNGMKLRLEMTATNNTTFSTASDALSNIPVELSEIPIGNIAVTLLSIADGSVLITISGSGILSARYKDEYGNMRTITSESAVVGTYRFYPPINIPVAYVLDSTEGQERVIYTMRLAGNNYLSAPRAGDSLLLSRNIQTPTDTKCAVDIIAMHSVDKPKSYYLGMANRTHRAGAILLDNWDAFRRLYLYKGDMLFRRQDGICLRVAVSGMNRDRLLPGDSIQKGAISVSLTEVGGGVEVLQRIEAYP